jgi:hypothetical protein
LLFQILHLYRYFVAPVGAGGSNTSLENNNVFAVEPRMYVQGEDGESVEVWVALTPGGC